MVTVYLMQNLLGTKNLTLNIFKQNSHFFMSFVLKNESI